VFMYHTSIILSAIRIDPSVVDVVVDADDEDR